MKPKNDLSDLAFPGGDVDYDFNPENNFKIEKKRAEEKKAPKKQQSNDGFTSFSWDGGDVDASGPDSDDDFIGKSSHNKGKPGGKSGGFGGERQGGFRGGGDRRGGGFGGNRDRRSDGDRQSGFNRNRRQENSFGGDRQGGFKGGGDRDRQGGFRGGDRDRQGGGFGGDRDRRPSGGFGGDRGGRRGFHSMALNSYLQNNVENVKM
jgi:hypothetical protein